MKITDFSPFYADQIATIKTLAGGGSLWAADAAALLPKLTKAYKTNETDALMATMFTAQRLYNIMQAGVENDPKFRAAMDTQKIPGWESWTAPPVSDELQNALAAKIYNAKTGGKDFGVIRLGDGSRDIGAWLVRRCVKDKVPFVVHFMDGDANATILNHATDDGARQMGKAFTAMTGPANKSMVVYPGMPERKGISADPAKAKIYGEESKYLGLRASTGELFYTLTMIPTREDARIDGINYDDYVKLFFEMCDQPWDEISKAQVELIKEFNTATKVRITNNDGTDVSMELVDHDGSHFTFCNSLIAKNVPGSEIFSAPRRDSVNGVVVAKGRFEHDHEVIEDLTMEFENGELIRYDAKSGLDAFKKAVEMDNGARFVGELGIGTNPHLKQHVANGLLVEKIGGSFHLALGRPYSYTEYGGEKVKVDNGGKSKLHWDITTMLHGKDGCIYLDGRKVMDNGQWLDRKYDVLNRGWESLPKSQRPAYWKNYYDAKP